MCSFRIFFFQTILIMLRMAFSAHASISEDQLVALPNKVNQPTAVQLCRQQGMNLIRIQDDQTNIIVYNFAVKRGLGQYWIDANDRAQENNFVYEDGSRITYSKWPRGEPNNYNNEDCVHGLFYQNGLWNDIKCDIKNSVICYREKSQNVIDSITEDQLIAFPNKVNQQQAVQICRNNGMELVKVPDEQSNQVLFRFAQIRGLGQYWLDGNDRVTEGNWVYEDGNRLSYSKWQPGEPNNMGKEDCIHGSFHPNGFWNDISCNANCAVICYVRKSEIKTVDINENQLVVLPGKFNQQTAVNMCKAKGLNLIKVQNDKINQLVYNFAVKNNVGQYWMDANDNQQETVWVYDNGHRITYGKWHPGEPNNYGVENCLHGLFYQNGYWNDISCNANNAVICYKDSTSVEIEPKEKPNTENEKEKEETETKTITETISILVTNEKMTNQEAIKYCKDQNLKLIRLESAALNKQVYAMAAQKKFEPYWIDGSKSNGDWTDSDGNPLKYKNFKSGVSDDGDCIIGYAFQNDLWNVAPCDSKQNVLCYGV